MKESNVQAFTRDSTEVGGCCGCGYRRDPAGTNPSDPVWVIRARRSGQEVRFCDACLDELIAAVAHHRSTTP